jgi:hypothetical protein
VTSFALAFGILLSIGTLAWEYAQAELASLSLFLLFFGIAWLFSLWRNWDWFSSLGLFVAVFAAAIGFWFELNSSWMMAGAAFALFAWDMAEFRRRLRAIIVDDQIRGMERRHIARVSLVILAGMFLVTIALLVQLRFTFEWGVLLVIVILLGIAQLVAWFRRQ